MSRRGVAPSPQAGVGYPRLDAYGDGGFRIAGARHAGSVLVLNGAVHAWAPAALAAADAAAFDPVFAADPRPDLVLFGVGARMAPPPATTMARFREAAIGLEFMDTAAACRVYASLVGEGRRFAAALIAV